MYNQYPKLNQLYLGTHLFPKNFSSASGQITIDWHEQAEICRTQFSKLNAVKIHADTDYIWKLTFDYLCVSVSTFVTKINFCAKHII